MASLLSPQSREAANTTPDANTAPPPQPRARLTSAPAAGPRLRRPAPAAHRGLRRPGTAPGRAAGSCVGVTGPGRAVGGCAGVTLRTGEAVPLYPWRGSVLRLAGRSGRKQAHQCSLWRKPKGEAALYWEQLAQFMEGLLGLKEEVGNDGFGLVSQRQSRANGEGERVWCSVAGTW